MLESIKSALFFKIISSKNRPLSKLFSTPHYCHAEPCLREGGDHSASKIDPEINSG